MSYLGNQPLSGQFKKLDALTFNGVTSTFALTSSGVAVVPGTAQNLLISLSGVLQEPGSAYTVSGSYITFDAPPTLGTPFFGIVLGYVGIVQTPTDGSITFAKLATGLALQNTQTTAESTLATVANQYFLANSTGQSAGTNLMYASEALENTMFWNASSASVTVNPTMAPDGMMTADKLVENSASGVPHFISQSVSYFSSGTPITFSLFVKAAERTQVMVRLLASGAFTTTRYFYFDIASGTISAQSGTQTNSVTYYGDGWYRLSLSAATDAAGSALAGVFLAVGGNNTYAGDGVSGVYVWGTQLETGSTMTSYMPSTTSQGTRLAGVAAPQRLVLPASPNTFDKVGCKPANNLSTNVIDPNGNTIETVAGPFKINSPSFNAVLQYINGTWRFV